MCCSWSTDIKEQTYRSTTPRHTHKLSRAGKELLDCVKTLFHLVSFVGFDHLLYSRCVVPVKKKSCYFEERTILSSDNRNSYHIQSNSTAAPRHRIGLFRTVDRVFPHCAFSHRAFQHRTVKKVIPRHTVTLIRSKIYYSFLAASGVKRTRRNPMGNIKHVFGDAFSL